MAAGFFVGALLFCPDLGVLLCNLYQLINTEAGRDQQNNDQRQCPEEIPSAAQLLVAAHTRFPGAAVEVALTGSRSCSGLCGRRSGLRMIRSAALGALGATLCLGGLCNAICAIRLRTVRETRSRAR